MAQPLEPRIKRLYALTTQDVIAKRVDESALTDDMFSELTPGQRHDITRDMTTYNEDARYLHECRAQLANLTRKREGRYTDRDRAQLNKTIAGLTASQTRIDERYALDDLRIELAQQNANAASDIVSDLNPNFGVKRSQKSYTAHRGVLRHYEGKEMSELDYDRLGAEIEELRELDGGLHL